MPRIAFLTISLLQEPLGHPQVQDFIDRTPSVFAYARQSAGFIHLLSDPDWNTWKCPTLFQSEVTTGRLSVTLSVWRDLEAVFAFAYNGPHAHALRKRRDWFTAPLAPPYVAWWIDNNHIPTWDEASERFERLLQAGPTVQAFDFKHPFNAAGQPVQISRN